MAAVKDAEADGAFYRLGGGERRRSGEETVGGGELKFIVFHALVTRRGTEGQCPLREEKRQLGRCLIL
jgi:hypothetical protein